MTGVMETTLETFLPVEAQPLGTAVPSLSCCACHTPCIQLAALRKAGHYQAGSEPPTITEGHRSTTRRGPGPQEGTLTPLPGYCRCQQDLPKHQSLGHTESPLPLPRASPIPCRL